MSRVIVTFAAEAVDEIIANGGSQSWAVNKDRACKYEYLVCTRNAHNKLTDGNEPHASAFLIGKISDVVVAPSPKRPNEIGRWMVKISAYAEVDLPEIWRGWRNPIRYTTLQELGIDAEALIFTPVPAAEGDGE